MLVRCKKTRAEVIVSGIKDSAESRKTALRYLASILRARALGIPTAQDVGLVRDWTEDDLLNKEWEPRRLNGG